MDEVDRSVAGWHRTQYQHQGGGMAGSRGAIFCAFTIAIVSLLNGKAAQAKETNTEVIPGQYVVAIKAQAAERFSERDMSSMLYAQVLERIRPDLLLIQRPVGEATSDAISVLQSNPMIEMIEPNFIYHTDKVPNDPIYPKQWGMKNTGQKDSDNVVGKPGVDVHAEAAWDIETGSSKTVLAVIDTGVDFTIPDLKGNAWTNLIEFNGKPQIDDDNNGYIDDIHGFDFAANKGEVVDDNGHGSHCAGTIGARGDDGVGIAGLNWNIRIMAVKFLDKNGGGSLANAVKAIDYARKNGAKIMSNSWGGGEASDILKKAIEDARDAGALFVVAAGNSSADNDSSPHFPASYPVDNIISVAALTNVGTLADFSNYGLQSVHVAAPGQNILSTFPQALDPSGTKSESGTSMATPFVAGIAALLLSHDSSLSYKDLKQRILRTVRPMSELRGKVASGGIVDAYLALSNQQAPPDANDPNNWNLRQDYKVSTPHPYLNKSNLEFKASVPGAHSVAIHFAKFKTEAVYDFVEFFDSTGKSLGKKSGYGDNQFSPAASGDTIIMKFTSDDTVNDYGFDTDFVEYR